MKAARLYDYDPALNVKLRIEQVQAPTIMAPDEVIVRVGAAGLCRTDLHIIEGVWREIMDPEGRLLPYIMGHENAGWVEDVGSGVRSVKPGDAVFKLIGNTRPNNSRSNHLTLHYSKRSFSALMKPLNLLVQAAELYTALYPATNSKLVRLAVVPSLHEKQLIISLIHKPYESNTQTTHQRR